MSQENVEIVKAIFKAWEDRDPDAALRLIDPSVEVDVTAAEVWGERDIVHGHDALQRFLTGLLEAWQELEFFPETFIEAGDEVVVHLRITGRGRGSGVFTERYGASVYTVRSGMVTRWRAFETLSDATKAAGI
jgi:ketosteroid isomerase-like protein